MLWLPAAAISNARAILRLRDEFGSFAEWLHVHSRLEEPAWVALFKKTFRFTGGEITGEFLMSTGYLPGAHTETCPAFARIVESNPPWLKAGLDHVERA